MSKSSVSAALELTAITAFSAMPPPADVERVLEGKITEDNFVDVEEPPYVPLRYRNSLVEYDFFIRKYGLICIRWRNKRYLML